MNPRYLRDLSVVSACLEADVAVFLWGPPGSGKSSAIRRVAEERNYRLTEMTPSILDPTDLLGLPYQVGQSTRYATPDWLADILEVPEERHLIFLDEMNLAPPAVTNACLRLVLERAAHTTQLPPGVRFAGAGNDPSQVPTAQFLSPAMANRFAHVEWEGLSDMELLEAEMGGYPVPPLPSPVDKNWKTLHAAFGAARPAMGNDFLGGKGEAAKTGRGYPTSRSWRMLTRALPHAGGDGDVERGLAEAIVGSAAASEFIQFAATADLIDPKEWLEDPKLARPLERDDLTSAALLAVAAEAAKEPLRGDRLAAAIHVFCQMAEVSGRQSICAPAIRVTNDKVTEYFAERKGRGSQKISQAIERMHTAFGESLKALDAHQQAIKRGSR